LALDSFYRVRELAVVQLFQFERDPLEEFRVERDVVVLESICFHHLIYNLLNGEKIIVKPRSDGCDDLI